MLLWYFLLKLFFKMFLSEVCFFNTMKFRNDSTSKFLFLINRFFSF